MRALPQRRLPASPGEHAAEVGGVEEQTGSDGVSHLPHRGDRVRDQVPASAEGDQPWPDTVGEFGESVHIDGELFRINGGLNDLRPKSPAAPAR